MPALDFLKVFAVWDELLFGAAMTVALTATAGAVSIVFGTLLAVGRTTTNRWVSRPVAAFVWLILGTPLLLQLFVLYFGLVRIGIDLNAFTAGVIGLSVHYAAYNADVVRAGIASIDKGQTEAARALGLGRFAALYKVVLPQALRRVAPALGNNMIALLKESSLVSFIGVMELTLTAQRMISETFRPFEFYLAAVAMYYVINLGLEAVLRRIERGPQAKAAAAAAPVAAVGDRVA
ncbi:MAG TPA: amino acid ABC transporter permease [Methylomirabilota bacterium]|nr:amino acid ABC transporter permease [Methylomirabilota bacterium]